MKVEIEKRENPNIEQYRKEDLEIAKKFVGSIYKEMGTFIKAAVLFGSTARKTEKRESDIDVLIVIDDLTIHLNNELVEAYRIIVQRIISQTSLRLHITSLKLTAFWEYIRNGDPIGVNILRDGVPLIDTGFFEPLQILLKQGKIRPTQESIWTYFMRAPNTLHNSKWHILQAVVDLYWAVIDAAHSALMKLGEVPPSPNHIADLMEKRMVKKHLLEHKYVVTMRNFYRIAKMIGHRQISEIKGEEFDKYFKDAEAFITRMRKFIEVE